MTTVAEMTQWFRKAFTETQSQMLAEATVRLHEDLVRREDFTTLTKTVERLAERTDCIAVAQQQTTQELRELAIMQKETGHELKALADIQKELSESTKMVRKGRPMALRQATAWRGGSCGATAGAGWAVCGPTVEAPRSFLSTLKAGFVSSAQTGLETALLTGRAHRDTGSRQRLRMSITVSSSGDA